MLLFGIGTKALPSWDSRTLPSPRANTRPRLDAHRWTDCIIQRHDAEIHYTVDAATVSGLGILEQLRSMAFNLPQFLRRTPRDSLKSYFAFRAITLAVGFDWSAAQRAFLNALRGAVENLPDKDRERAYHDFEYADMLADESGQLAIRSLFAEQTQFMLALERLENSEARSLAALMENETAFRKALAVRLADRLRTGRSWSGFLIGPTAGVLRASKLTAALTAFETDVRVIFMKLDGSGRRISIDRFERDNPRISRRITQYTVFVEGLPQANNEFEGEKLVPRARRPVFEAALCHDPANGTIDVVCKGGRRVRLDIARAFVRRLMGSQSDPKAVRLRNLYLDGLKSKMPFATDPNDGVPACGRHLTSPKRCQRQLWTDHSRGGKRSH